jgi:tetratricopeptide (TPR) repeat protein
MFPGKLIELNASTGASVTKGAVIARVMWTDARGRPATGGTAVAITAPADGTVEVFVTPNSQFLQGEAPFRVDPDDTAKGRASDDDLRPTLERALAAAMQNNWGYAERLCKQVLDAHPTNPAMEAVALKYRALALGFVGYQAADRMLLDEALIEGRRAVRAFQRTSEPQQNVAGAYKAIGNAIGFMIAQGVMRDDEWPMLFPEGIAALKKAIELDPEDAQARKHLGIMYAAEPVAKMYGAKTK